MASDPNLQVLGAAYIQHRCYSDTAAKKQVTTPLATLYCPLVIALPALGVPGDHLHHLPISPTSGL